MKVIIGEYNCKTGTLTSCWRHATHPWLSSPSPCQLLDPRHPHWHLCMPLAADPWRPHVGAADRSKGTIQSSACQQLPSGILGICPTMDEWGQAAGAGRSADTTWISTRRSHLMHSPDTPKIRACWDLVRWRELTCYFHPNVSGPRDQELQELWRTRAERECDWSRSGGSLPQNVPPSVFTMQADGTVTLRSGYIVSGILLFVHFWVSVYTSRKPVWPCRISGPFSSAAVGLFTRY